MIATAASQVNFSRAHGRIPEACSSAIIHEGGSVQLVSHETSGTSRQLPNQVDRVGLTASTLIAQMANFSWRWCYLGSLNSLPSFGYPSGSTPSKACVTITGRRADAHQVFRTVLGQGG